MPAKLRAPKERRLSFSAEALGLFAELDRVPLRARDDAGFKAQERRLHDLLGLGYEWFCLCASILDRGAASCHHPGMVAYDAWHKVRAVRQELLAAVKDSEHGVSARAARPD